MKCHNGRTVRYILHGKPSAVVPYTSIGHCPMQSFVREPSDLAWLPLWSVLSPVSAGTRRMLHTAQTAFYLQVIHISVSVCLWPFIRVVHKKVLIQSVHPHLTKVCLIAVIRHFLSVL